jgi:hypothetical protein
LPETPAGAADDYGIAGPDDETAPMPVIPRDGGLAGRELTVSLGSQAAAAPSPEPVRSPRAGSDASRIRGPFEPANAAGHAGADGPAGPAGQPRSAEPASPSAGPSPSAAPIVAPTAGASAGQAMSQAARASMWSPGAAKMDQIKDLYLTAEAIGEDALDKHFQQVSERQRQLIREYFDQVVGGQAEGTDRG